MPGDGRCLTLSLVGSTDPASRDPLKLRVGRVCAGGLFLPLPGKNLSRCHCGKYVLCFLKATLCCSLGKAECEGLLTSVSGDITTFLLLWRDVAVGRAESGCKE